MSRPSSRRLIIGAVAAGLAGLSFATFAPAASADPTTLTVAYDASGSSYIAKPGATVALGPTTLTTTLNLTTGRFTGSLPLPPTSTTFSIAGLLPIAATVSFVPVGAVTGSLKPNPVPHVVATTNYYLKLSNVTVGGLPAFVGDSCQTASPATITVRTPPKQRFNVLSGGTVAGTYTIGSFANCGLTTPLINLLVPGSGNTVSFTLSNGHLAG